MAEIDVTPSQDPATEVRKKDPLATRKAKIAIAFAEYSEDGSKTFPTLNGLMSETYPDALTGLTGDALSAKTKIVRKNVQRTLGGYARDLEILKASRSYSLTVASSKAVLEEIRARNPGRYDGPEGIDKLIKLIATPLSDERT